MTLKGVDFKNSDVLELGAGPGGYSKYLKEVSRSFIASDLHKHEHMSKHGIVFEEVDVMKPFPFEDDKFDVIFCSSVIEHVSDPGNLLEESWRTLKSGGKLMLSFPPFYSLFLIGGHQFKPFHFLGEKLAVRLTNLVHQENHKSYKTCFGDNGLYPLTIDKVASLLEKHNFGLSEVFTRMGFINTAGLPGILKDLTTWHVCYVAYKL